MTPMELVQKEVVKQVERYGPENDAKYTEKELIMAANAYLRMYLAGTLGDRELAQGYWPWDHGWNPETPRETLIKAAAFIVSELERIK